MLNCREIARTIATEELAARPWRERLAVRFHLLMCRHCRRYARQLGELGSAARELLRETRVDPESRQRLRSSILDRIPGGEEPTNESG